MAADQKSAEEKNRAWRVRMNWNVRLGRFARKGTKYRLRGHRSSSAAVQAALFGSEREITAQYGNAPVEERQFKLFTQVYHWSSPYRLGIGPRLGENARARIWCLAGESHPVWMGINRASNWDDWRRGR